MPPPDILHAYTFEEQEKILAWSDALILDESRRSDELVNAAIDSVRRDQMLSFLSASIPTIAALIALIATNDPISLSFLAVPGITIGVNVINAIRREKDSENGG